MKLIRPQLASSEIPDIYTQVTWPKIIQPKLDGICCLAVNGVAMSRTMKPIPNKYVQKVFNELNLHGLHGELMVDGDFNSVQSAIMSEGGEPDFYYVVYDMWDGTGIYTERLQKVALSVVGYEHLSMIASEIVLCADSCNIVLSDYVSQGYEGAMLRDPNSLYKQGRHTLKSQALMKLKKFYDDEAIIVGFEEKLHNENVQEKDERGYAKRSQKKEGMVPANTLGSLIVKWKGLQFNIGSGYDDTMRKYIWGNRVNLVGKFVTFKYQELSKYGVPRFPVFKCIREEYN